MFNIGDKVNIGGDMDYNVYTVKFVHDILGTKVYKLSDDMNYFEWEISLNQTETPNHDLEHQFANMINTTYDLYRTALLNGDHPEITRNYLSILNSAGLDVSVTMV